MEVLVAVAIVGALAALMLPAVQQARESARRLQCCHQLRQLGLALNNYAEVHRVFPPSSCFASGSQSVDVSHWSIHSRLLAFLDQSNAAALIDFDLGWNHVANQITGIPQTQFSGLSCPTDPRVQNAHYSGPKEGYVYPTNYAYCFGTWVVYDPTMSSCSDGCFFPNRSIRSADILDGMSNTLAVSEVKSYQPCIVDTLDPGPMPPTVPVVPEIYVNDAGLLPGPSPDDHEGHTEWCEGQVHETGFTTAFAPNQQVLLDVPGLGIFDVDWSTRSEGTSSTQPTYAAVTARSYHACLVNILLMDGSVRPASNQVTLSVWRALGTRNGND